MMEQDYIDFRDGGVSESIGFLLIFTIVITGIGLVTLYGYPMLIQQQTGADQQIMEKNMIVLQNDFKSIVYKTVPYKETSLKIGGGSLSLNNLHQINDHGPTFRIYDSGVDLMPANNTGDLRYKATDSQEEISLQNGAVVKHEIVSSAGSVMLAQPRWFFDDTTHTMVINVVCINSSAYMAHEGIGTVQMELGPTDYFIKSYYPGYSVVSIDYTPDTTAANQQDYTTAWKDYFERTMKMTCSGSPTLTCNTPPATVQTIVIKRTEIIINSI
jgi:hypothetical protein